MDEIINPRNGKGGIYLGSIDSAMDLSELQNNDIRAVLTIAQGTDLCYPKDAIDNHLIVESKDVIT